MKKILLILAILMSCVLNAQDTRPPQKAPRGIHTKFVQLDTLTTTQKLAIPQIEGTLVYDTDLDVLQFFDGTSWVSGGGGGLTNVVEDLTPQLGGDLDLNSKNITGAGIINIDGSLYVDDGTYYYQLENGIQVYDNTSEDTAGIVPFALDFVDSSTSFSTSFSPPITPIGTTIFRAPAKSTGTYTLATTADITGGASQLSDLTDVNTSTPTNRNVLVADGTDWESRALVVADVSDFTSTLAGTTNTTAFTPTTDYHVATKKYVDDAIVGGGGYTDEQAQDAVGTILSSEFVYNDATPSITIAANGVAYSKLSAPVQASLDLADTSVQDLTDLGLTATSTELNYVDGVTSAIQTQLDSKLATATAASTYQPLDTDLTTIAGLTPTTDNFIQSKAGAWASRTVAQVKTDLGLAGTNNGDQTSIVGITGTKAQFDTAVTDGNFMYVGDGVSASSIGVGDLASGVLPYSTATASSSNFKIPFLETASGTSGNYGILHDSDSNLTYNPLTNNLTASSFTGTSITTSADVYDSGWNSDNTVPTKNDVYDKIEAQQVIIDALEEGGISVSSTITTSRNALLTDADGMNVSTSATNVTVTIPLNSSVAFPVGTILTYKQNGAGNVIIAYTGGVTGTVTQTYEVDQIIRLWKTATDTWQVVDPNLPLMPKSVANNTTIDLWNVGGARYVASANSATNYVVTVSEVGGWAKILINAATEPTVNSVSTGKVSGATFEASTDMFMVIYSDNGTDINYFFSAITGGGGGGSESTTVTDTNDINLTLTGAAISADLLATSISAKTAVTAVTGDYVLLWDATDSALKKANVSDFGGGSGDDVSTFSEKSGALVGTDRLVGLSGATDFNETISGIPLSIFNNDLSMMTLNTAQSITAGAKKTFSADATNAGLSLSGVTADPSGAVNGDLWYRTDGQALRYRTNNINSTIANLDQAQTFTTKTLALGSNTVSGTKAQFDTAVTDGNFLYVGDVVSYTDAPIASANNTTIALSKAGGEMFVTSANSATNYTVSITGSKVGAWAKVLINAATEPTVNTVSTGKIAGAAFQASTDMYMIIFTDNGTDIKYYFTAISGADVPEHTHTESDITDLHSKPILTKGITIPDIVAADDATMFFTPIAITVTSVNSHITGTTNVVFNINHASTRTGTGLDVFTSDITLTSTAGQTNNSGFNDATIPANSWVWLDVVSVSGTPTLFHTTLIYTED